MRQPHAGMAVAESVAQIDHLHSCPCVSEVIPSTSSMSNFPSFPKCSMLTGQDSTGESEAPPAGSAVPWRSGARSHGPAGGFFRGMTACPTPKRLEATNAS